MPRCPPLNHADNSEIRTAGKGPPRHEGTPLDRGKIGGVGGAIYRAFYHRSLYKVSTANGPVAQGIEQQPSKLKVAGSNPAGVANKIKHLTVEDQ